MKRRKRKKIDLNEYYKTKWWQQRSKEYREKVGKCERCGTKKNLHTHHKRYRFYREKDRDLECLCNYCHLVVEHKQDKDGLNMLDFNHSNQTERLVYLIDQALEQENQKKTSRNYLGGSRLGEQCDRALQFEFFNTPKDEGKGFNGQTLRTFEIGHALEDMAARWIRKAELDLRTHNKDGYQFGFETGKGAIKGHIDGVIVGGPEEFGPYPRLWECKTAKGQKWREMQKHRIKKANWTYYIQCQLYMAYMELTENPALFTAINKDTSELYFENVAFDSSAAQEASDRGARIIEACWNGEILPRITKDPSFYMCKYCAWSDRCWSMKQ